MNTMRRAGVVLAMVVGSFVAAAGTVAADEAAGRRCERGEFCLWSREDYRGAIRRLDLATANPGECIPLPGGFDGRSFANRTTREVTVYQARDCSTEGEFDTYPGGGTYVPVAPYLVRGVQIWESRADDSMSASMLAWHRSAGARRMSWWNGCGEPPSGRGAA